MSIQNDKLMNLQDGQVLYNDLRDRIEDTKLNTTLSTSTPVVSFSDGAPYPMSMQFAIEPLQDLHGYSSPWPGGGGKNLLPITVDGLKSLNTSGTWSGNVYTRYGITYTILTDTNGNVIGINTNGTSITDGGFQLVNSTSVASGDYILNGCPAGGSTTTYYIKSVSGNKIDTGSGTEASIATTANIYIQINNGTQMSNKVFYPMLRLATVSDATFEPYTNICPISGYTGANVTVTGKNLLNPNTINENTYVRVVNGNLNSATDWNTSDYIRVLPGIRYHLGMVHASTGSSGVVFYDFTKKYISGIKGNDLNKQNYTFTVPENATYIRFSWDKAESYNPNWITTVYVCVDGELTAFESFSGNVYPITFPTSTGTVYGGTVKVNPDGTGELVVDRIAIDLQNASLGTSGTNTQGKYRIRIQTGTYNTFEPTINNNTAKEYLKSNKYPTIPAGSIGTYGCHMGISVDTGGFLYLYDDEIQTVADAAASGTIVCVRIATPITYSLTPGQILSILGQNNIWTDIGDIQSLSYVRQTVPEMIRQDTAGQIATTVNPVESSLAIVVDGDTAPKNITSGQYVYVKNHSTLATGMYHATAAIASGASITSSNVEADEEGIANVLRMEKKQLQAIEIDSRIATVGNQRTFISNRIVQTFLDFTVGSTTIPYWTTIFKYNIAIPEAGDIYGAMGVRDRTNGVLLPEYVLLSQLTTDTAGVRISCDLNANTRYQVIATFLI